MISSRAATPFQSPLVTSTIHQPFVTFEDHSALSPILSSDKGIPIIGILLFLLLLIVLAILLLRNRRR